MCSAKCFKLSSDRGIATELERETLRQSETELQRTSVFFFNCGEMKNFFGKKKKWKQKGVNKVKKNKGNPGGSSRRLGGERANLNLSDRLLKNPQAAH